MVHAEQRDVLILQPGEVDVWLAEPPDDAETSLLWPGASVLSEEERDHLQRFVFAGDRQQYLAAHAWLRATLSLYAPVRASDWNFTRNVYGRPEVAGREATWLRFNLSHTANLIAVAVAFKDDLGVDVENTCRRDPPLEVADRYFAPCEVADLRALSVSAQRDAFFDYWTLKEAYIKARGLGLALPLDQFAFHLVRDRKPRIAFAAGLDDDPGAWQFALARATPCHRLAVALRTTAALRLRVRRIRRINAGDA